MKCIENITFLTREKSTVFLKDIDEFIQNFTEADIILRNMTDGENTTNNVLEYFSEQALEWSHSEIKRLIKIFEDIDDRLEKLGFLFKFKNINIIKTTGNEEGGQVFYTRESAIIIAENRLSLPDKVLFSCLAHELFHIFSKQNKSLRAELYNAVGFVGCRKIIFPENFYNNRITNPDGIDQNYYYVLDDDEKTKFLPYIFIDKDQKKGTLFDRILVKMVKIKEISNNEYKAICEKDKLVYLEKAQVNRYKEQIGGNLVNNDHHPDEIAADLFCNIVVGGDGWDLNSHPVFKNIKKILFQE